MISYKTIVRGLIKNCITDYLNQSYTGYVDGVRFDALTISKDKCIFTARATIIFIFSRVYIITGEVLPSGSVFISRVEVEP